MRNVHRGILPSAHSIVLVWPPPGRAGWIGWLALQPLSQPAPRGVWVAVMIPCEWGLPSAVRELVGSYIPLSWRDPSFVGLVFGLTTSRVPPPCPPSSPTGFPAGRRHRHRPQHPQPRPAFSCYLPAPSGVKWDGPHREGGALCVAVLGSVSRLSPSSTSPSRRSRTNDFIRLRRSLGELGQASTSSRSRCVATPRMGYPKDRVNRSNAVSGTRV